MGEKHNNETEADQDTGGGEESGVEILSRVLSRMLMCLRIWLWWYLVSVDSVESGLPVAVFGALVRVDHGLLQIGREALEGLFQHVDVRPTQSNTVKHNQTQPTQPESTQLNSQRKGRRKPGAKNRDSHSLVHSSLRQVALWAQCTPETVKD